MRYSDDIIEEVRMKNDIVDVISQYVRLTRRGSSYFGLCPFHNEKTPSFSVTPSKQMYYCFGCGAGGNVYNFVMQYENYSFGEALSHLAERAGVELPKIEYSKEARAKAEKRAALLEINKKAAQYFYYQLRREGGKNAHDYLTGRGLSEETIRKFGLGYSDKYSDDLYKYLKSQNYSDELLRESGLFNVDERQGMYDKFWNRVIFPIMDVNNRVIGFGGRVMGDGKPKYLNSPETTIFDKSRNLYGLNVARTTRKNYLILCEGYMDVISMHQAGFNQAVASLGTALTPGQASLMKRYTDNVLITYDSDEAGVKAALRAIPILKTAGLSTKVINMRPYKDPDEFIKALGPEAFQERIDQAENSFMYEIAVIEKKYDRKDPEESTKFEREVAAKLVTFSEKLERDNYMKAVSQRFSIPYDGLAEMVARYGSKEGIIRKEPAAVEQNRNKQKKRKESGVRQAEKILLTWMIDDMDIFAKVKEYIEPADFIDPLLHDVAVKLYAQFEQGKVSPASIINTYETEEQHNEVAALFSADLGADLNRNEREKTLNDTVYKVKKNSLDDALQNTSDARVMQEILLKQVKLSSIHINL